MLLDHHLEHYILKIPGKENEIQLWDRLCQKYRIITLMHNNSYVEAKINDW